MLKIDAIKHSAGYEDARHFEKVTKEAFRFLVTDYGCKQFEPVIAGSECLIKYCNETTCVHITWEWHYFVVVELVRHNMASEGTIIKEAHDLEHLLTIRAPEKH